MRHFPLSTAKGHVNRSLFNAIISGLHYVGKGLERPRLQQLPVGNRKKAYVTGSLLFHLDDWSRIEWLAAGPDGQCLLAVIGECEMVNLNMMVLASLYAFR